MIFLPLTQMHASYEFKNPKQTLAGLLHDSFQNHKPWGQSGAM
jgi:hypothetical protein